MDWSCVATQVRVQGYVLCREWQCKAAGSYVWCSCILIILHLGTVPCATVIVCLVNIIAACIKKDAEITFECEGADEEAALAKMEELEADNFGD